MIHPNELRRGNYVETPNGIKQIRYFVKDIANFDNGECWSCEVLNPIKLTEEYLLKFGWVWNKECNSFEKYPNGDGRMYMRFRDVSNSYVMFNYVLKSLTAERIWYVHQLQNLYFALTGKELDIKELV